MFAERLADNVIKGELFIGNWNTEQGSDITVQQHALTLIINAVLTMIGRFAS